MVVPAETVDCVSCKGSGELSPGACVACGGIGKISVAQPATLCPHCVGTGKIPAKDTIYFSTPFCPVCRGMGWALILTA